MDTQVEHVIFTFTHKENGCNETVDLTVRDLIDSGTPICQSCDVEFELKDTCVILP